jgi:hypothetical protein
MKAINQLKKKDEQWVVLNNTTANIQQQHDSVCCDIISSLVDRKIMSMDDKQRCKKEKVKRQLN